MPDLATLSTTDVSIANGATTSGALDCSSGRTLVGIILPAALTGTTMTFTTAPTSTGTYVPVYDPNATDAAYEVTVGTARYIPLNPVAFAGCRFIKLVSGASEGGVRTIKCVTRVV